MAVKAIIILILKLTDIPPKDPCEGNNICGPNSNCKVVQGRPTCSCLTGYIGAPPYCRPECSTSAECSLSEACINQKCKNPCAEEICGYNAKCNVVNHSPICSCPPKYVGDPFENCTPEREYKFLSNTYSNNLLNSILSQQQRNQSKATLAHLRLADLMLLVEKLTVEHPVLAYQECLELLQIAVRNA